MLKSLARRMVLALGGLLFAGGACVCVGAHDALMLVISFDQTEPSARAKVVKAFAVGGVMVALGAAALAGGAPGLRERKTPGSGKPGV